MCPHETLPELTMVRHIEMQQLVYDDVIRQLAIKREQVIAEIQISSSGARSPLVAHGPNRKRTHMHPELVGPLANAGLELVLIAPACHDHASPVLWSTEKMLSTSAETLS